ncbi:MAG: HAD family hydrolase [Thermoleophilia bacterium]
MLREMTIRGVTFDFWNTLYTDRAEGSAGDITARRLRVLRAALRECGVNPDEVALQEAHRAGFGAYLQAWQAGRHYGARDHVLHVLAAFRVRPQDGVVERAARLIEDLGGRAALRLLPGAADTLAALAQAGVALGLISDTGLTPGRVLVRYLERDGLLPHFHALTFSDETGFPKPDPRMFHVTLAAMGVGPGEAVHVGDMPRTDVAGALAVGMAPVRFAGVEDHREPPEPWAVIRDHRELLPLIGR